MVKHKIYLTENDRWNLVSIFLFKRRNVGLSKTDIGLAKVLGIYYPSMDDGLERGKR